MGDMTNADPLERSTNSNDIFARNQVRPQTRRRTPPSM